MGMVSHLSRRSAVGGLASVLVAARTVRAAPLGAPDLAAAAKLIEAARAQIGVTTLYDPAYRRLPFPGGDVPRDRGVCTDVIVRAYRTAFGYDLQARVHADMAAARASYPNRWGAQRPDPSIDHRRVANLQAFLRRQGAQRPRPMSWGDWQPGDLVTQLVGGRLPHIGIVSATLNADGARLMVIHNIGAGAREEDTLAAFEVTGRFRFLPVV